MLPVKQAEAIVLDLVQPLDAQRDRESLDLFSASGRILAAPMAGDLDFPHWDNSAMDGYALRYEDVAHSSASPTVELKVVEEIPAGKPPQVEIQGGQAARIFTGGMMPRGADTVIMQENTRRRGDRVEILAPPSEPGEFVRRKGAFYQAQTELLPAGSLLGPPDIAVLATAQCTQISAYRRPRVAILSTGNELVPPGQPLQPGQLVDSNQYALAAAVEALGGVPIAMGIIPDRPDALENAIASALTRADLVLSTGGVSVGDYDYVEEILEKLGGKIHIKQVAIKPGKPLTVARFHRDPLPVVYFGLPGNPVSALVTFWRFVQPAMKKLAGKASGWEPIFLEARSRQDLRAGGQRETYLWGQLQQGSSGYEFTLAGGSHSSGNLINLSQTTGLAVVPVGQQFIATGETLQVLPIGSPIVA
jgi:molybdopterin molybdotransferase